MAEETHEPLADEEIEYITLDFEDGASEECEVLGIFEVGDKEYIALIPEHDDEAVYLYGYEESKDPETDEILFDLRDIEDDAEFEAVSKTYESLVEALDD